MYKIGIIDDEPLIRESLVATIPWGMLDCEIIFQAEDGRKALELIREEQPDLVILDINMPELSGLDVLKQIREEGNLCQVIILSAYQDFNYAQKAIRYGVHDYIGKPIRNSIVEEVVKEATNKIDHVRAKAEEDLLMQEEMEVLTKYFTDTKQLVSSQVLANMIGHQGSNKPPLEQYDVIPKGAKNHATLVIKSKSKLSDVVINKRYILSFIESIRGKVDYTILQTMVNGDIVLVLFFNKQISANGYKVYAKLLSQAILEYVIEWKDVDVYIGISTLYNDVESFNHSYREADNAAKNHFFTSSQDIVFTDETKPDKRQAKFSIVHDLDYFYHTLLNNEEEAFDQQLKQLIAGIESYAKGNIAVAKTLLSEICITIARFSASKIGDTQQQMPLEEVLEGVEQLVHMEEAYGYIKTYMKTSISTNESVPEYSPAIIKVIKYIKTNYMYTITLESASNEVSLNGSYLSRILKKETGKNFSDIILEERMHAAKKLLRNPNLRLNEIATQIGYKDYSYFYQVFSKSEGITPMNYRKTCKEI